MARERIVIDTNVLISGLLSAKSKPALALERAVTVGHLVATADTLRELVTTLMAPKFDPYVTRGARDALLMRLAPLVEVVEVGRAIRACRDPNDDKFLEAAVNGRADVLVTGDKDLLALHPFGAVSIVTPADYLAR